MIESLCDRRWLLALLLGFLAVAVMVSSRPGPLVYAADFTSATETKLTASDPAAGDAFGFNVSMSGDTLVVGAGDDDGVGINSGSAYVFVRSGGTWSQQAKLTASDAAAGDRFGLGVSISGDTVVVGASEDQDAGLSSGSAYVFVRSGGVWSQQAKLTASDAAKGDSFGFTVSVSGDTAVVGAHRNDDAGTDSGSAYVFVRSGGTWSQQAKLTASDSAAQDHFGFPVSVSGDTTVVGAWQNDHAGTDSGSAYVFVRSGGVWTQQAKLTASDAAAGDVFGNALSVDGDTAVVAAPRDDDGASNSGSVYVFVRTGLTWSQQAKLTASDAAANDLFGVGLSVRGDTAVIGGFLNDDDGTNSGSAYVFVRSGVTWTQQTKLTASDAAAGDQFGFAASVSGDTVAIGARGDDHAGTFSGSVYVYEATPSDGDGDGVPDDQDDFPNSDTAPTVVIDGCDSGVGNQVLANGATFKDLIDEKAANATNHGKFVSGVSQLADRWKKDEFISGKEKGKITSCAARSDIP